jgi:hypothetical protein
LQSPYDLLEQPLFVASVRCFAEHFRVAIPQLANGHLLHRSDFFFDVHLHVCLLIVQGKSHGSLTAVDHTEHGFAGKLKAIGMGIARIRVVGRNWQRLTFPEPQNSRSKDRCDVDQSLLVGSARNVSAVGHGQKLRKEMWAGTWPSAASIVYLPGGGSS